MKLFKVFMDGSDRAEDNSVVGAHGDEKSTFQLDQAYVFGHHGGPIRGTEIISRFFGTGTSTRARKFVHRALLHLSHLQSQKEQMEEEWCVLQIQSSTTQEKVKKYLIKTLDMNGTSA